jgi:cytochrome P450
MLRERSMYPDGAVFNPARWLEPQYPTYQEPLTVYPNLQGFVSFGHGRRACPASNFTERSLTILVARIAWGFTIKRKIDPATKKEYPLYIKFEPTANPKPLPFDADIVPRSKARSDLIRKAVREGLSKDPLE